MLLKLYQVKANSNHRLGYNLNLSLVLEKRGQVCQKKILGYTDFLLVANSDGTKFSITICLVSPY